MASCLLWFSAPFSLYKLLSLNEEITTQPALFVLGCIKIRRYKCRTKSLTEQTRFVKHRIIEIPLIISLHGSHFTAISLCCLYDFFWLLTSFSFPFIQCVIKHRSTCVTYMWCAYMEFLCKGRLGKYFSTAKISCRSLTVLNITCSEPFRYHPGCRKPLTEWPDKYSPSFTAFLILLQATWHPW